MNSEIRRPAGMKPPGVNAQYNVALAGSLPVRIAAKARRAMFEVYCKHFPPAEKEAVLDVGVTCDQTYVASNYFEAWYPHKHRVTAVGMDDARFLETLYPGMTFVQADGRKLPFDDGSFDIVHSSAVIEHVGSDEEQRLFVTELLRVARRGVFITTPNRWYPIEFHTILPLIHWLPKPVFRKLVTMVRGEFFAREENLNLLGPTDLLGCVPSQYRHNTRLLRHHLLGWPSNLMLVVRKGDEGRR